MLTKAQAIANHRKMWCWIAGTTRKEKRFVTKEEALNHFGWPYIQNMCWCCAYAGPCSIKNCPIEWPDGGCLSEYSPYIKWNSAQVKYRNEYQYIADLAAQIANLPENPEASLSKAETLYRHRVMWNWIAQTSIQEQRCVQKYEAFTHFGWGPVEGFCWCCGYAGRFGLLNICLRCPISDCYPYHPWVKACINDDYISAARYAYQLAELPENPKA